MLLPAGPGRPQLASPRGGWRQAAGFASRTRRRPDEKGYRLITSDDPQAGHGPAAHPADTQAADDLPPRLRAVCDLRVADVRELGGRHEYDGTIQDLTQHGV